MTKGASESNIKEKNSSYYLLPLETFHLTFTKKTEIFRKSTQFKCINEALALLLTLLHIMSPNGHTHFKNLAANAAKFLNSV